MRTHFFIIYLTIGLALFSGSILLTQYYFFRQFSYAETAVLISGPDAKIIAEMPIDVSQIDPIYPVREDFFEPTHYVNFSYLNVRSEPTIYSDMEKKIYRGEKVALFKRVNRDWCQIEIPRVAIRGFVACRYLSPII